MDVLGVEKGKVDGEDWMKGMAGRPYGGAF